MRLPAILLLNACLAGCGLIYKIDLQQGSYLTQDAAARLKVGMSKAEARQVLGTPLLSDAFDATRWDYYFSNVQGSRREDSKRFTVFFENDKVVSFLGNTQPPDPAPVNTNATPTATIK